MNPWKQWRGLNALVVDAVVHGSEAVERVQRGLANTPFGILEQIPPLAAPVKVVRSIHSLALATTHGSIRWTARAVGAAVEAGLDVVEKREPT